MLKAHLSLFGGSVWLTLPIQSHPHFMLGDITPPMMEISRESPNLITISDYTVIEDWEDSPAA